VATPQQRPSPRVRPWLFLVLLLAVVAAAGVALLLPGPLQRSAPTSHSASPAPADIPPPLMQEAKPSTAAAAAPCPTPKRSKSRIALIEAVVDETGRVESACIVVSVSPAFDQQALAFVRNHHYEPAVQDGKPIKVFLSISVWQHP
jgi:TonB family protein